MFELSDVFGSKTVLIGCAGLRPGVVRLTVSFLIVSDRLVTGSAVFLLLVTNNGSFILCLENREVPVTLGHWTPVWRGGWEGRPPPSPASPPGVAPCAVFLEPVLSCVDATVSFFFFLSFFSIF